MKKVAVDFKFLTQDLLEEIVQVYPQGFTEADLISFKNVDNEIEHRVKVVLNDTLFLIKKNSLSKMLNDKFDDKFDDAYFSSLPKGDEYYDAEV
jgi:hypothetical protein